MKDNKLTKLFHQLKVDMKEMTFFEKVEHIFCNFKEYIIFGLFAIFFVTIMLYSVLNPEKEVVISGTAINANLTAEGLDYISTDYFDYMKANKKKQEVLISSTFFKTAGSQQELDYSYTAWMNVGSSVNSQSLDYLLSDETVLRLFIKDEIFLDLREFFTETEMKRFEEQKRIIYAQPEGEEKFPIAVSLVGTAFAEKYLQGKEPCYISFIVNSPRLDTCRVFWDYLMALENNNL